MTTKVRNSIYMVLGTMHTVLLTMVTQNMVPVHYAYAAALATIIVTSLMQAVGTGDPPAAS